MEKRILSIIFLSMTVMLFGCNRSSKEPVTSNTQKATPTSDLTNQVKTVYSDLSDLRDKVDAISVNVDAISKDLATIKASPTSEIGKQVEKLDTNFPILKDKVDSISTSLISVSKDLNSVSSNVDSLSGDYVRLASQVIALEPSNALLSTENEGYAIAGTKFGPFVITKRGMSQYQDGYKVKLGIGNLTMASYKGAKLHITWGVLSGHDRKWTNEQNKDFTIADELSSGSYTNVEIAITPARAEEIKTIQVGLDLTQIYLKTR
jgi:hypothetical protein